jgi:hypothetical protein
MGSGRFGRRNENPLRLFGLPIRDCQWYFVKFECVLLTRVTPHQNRLNTVRVCYQTEYIRAFVGTVGVTQVWCPRSTSQLDASSPTALRRGPVAKVFRFRAVHKKNGLDALIQCSI